mmetsp:Transcript_123047/g.359202  ORF Transcript_123047/g.359202 Transcript_123047/m.359202 type:complete len:225 (-) Transcript_123047:553-1227(-)
MHRMPSFPMLLPVKRSTSERTPCFSSVAQSALTPAALSSFSEKSIVPALKRTRPPAPPPGRAVARRRSIHWHQVTRPSSPSSTSAMEMVSRCGCPGFAASIVQRAAHSGCSSRSFASLSTASAAGPATPPAPGARRPLLPGVLGVPRCFGGGPGGCLGPSFAFADTGSGPVRCRFAGGWASSSGAPSSFTPPASPMASLHFFSNCVAQSSFSRIPSSASFSTSP